MTFGCECVLCGKGKNVNVPARYAECLSSPAENARDIHNANGKDISPDRDRERERRPHLQNRERTQTIALHINYECGTGGSFFQGWSQDRDIANARAPQSVDPASVRFDTQPRWPF